MMPNLSSTFRRFENTIQFQIDKKTVVDGDLAESSKVVEPLWFEGSLQPLNPRELLVKPEGQRKFKWWTLYTDLDMHVDTVVKDEHGVLFRVMNSTDWEDSGYRAYQLIEGPGIASGVPQA